MASKVFITARCKNKRLKLLRALGLKVGACLNFVCVCIEILKGALAHRAQTMRKRPLFTLITRAHWELSQCAFGGVKNGFCNLLRGRNIHFAQDPRVSFYFQLTRKTLARVYVRKASEQNEAGARAILRVLCRHKLDSVR